MFRRLVSRGPARVATISGLFALAAAVVPASAAPILYTGNGHYYERVATHTAWDAALSAADGLTFDPDGAGPLAPYDGYLVTITSAGEQSFLQTTFSGEYWMGGSDQASEGTWQWVAGPETGMVFWLGGPLGTALMFENWGAFEPNDNFGEDFLHNAGPYWNDLFPTTLPYVVEYSAPVTAVPEPASLLLFGTGAALVGRVLRRRRGAIANSRRDSIPTGGGRKKP